jgi:hypothetical protein
MLKLTHRLILGIIDPLDGVVDLCLHKSLKMSDNRNSFDPSEFRAGLNPDKYTGDVISTAPMFRSVNQAQRGVMQVCLRDENMEYLVVYYGASQSISREEKEIINAHINLP